MSMLNKIDYKLLTFLVWFCFASLFMYGYARGMDYFFAPFVTIGALIIVFQNQAKPVGMIKVLLFLFVIMVFSSYHFFFYKKPSGNFFEYLCYPATACCSAYAIYCFVLKNGNYAITLIRFLFLIFFSISVYRYFRSDSLLAKAGLSYLQNNYFYFVLMPLPILFLKPRSYIGWIALAICLFICISSMKRSSIIAISLIFSSFCLAQLVLESLSKKIILILFCAFVSAFFVRNQFLTDRYDRSVDRFERIETDLGSGRGNIIERFFDDDVWDVTTFPENLIGNGFESYSDKYERKLAAAHNDFLEILYSYGFIGLMLYLFFLFKLLRRCISLLKTKDLRFLSAQVSLILFIVYGAFANVFYFFFYSLPLFFMIGILEGIEYGGKQCLIQKNE